jgi:hypothetical protein
MGETRTDQLSFRIDRDVMDRLDKASIVEDLKRADLARKIFAWAFRAYESAGSLHALRSVLSSHLQQHNPPVNMDDRVTAVLTELERHERPPAKKRKSGSHRA